MANIGGVRLETHRAHPSNYTRGRGGRSIKYITIHHMAGTPNTLRYAWQDPARNASSHLGVFPNKIEKYLSYNDTSWANGNWRSNQESVTIENWGWWEPGKPGNNNQQVLKNLEVLLRHLHRLFPQAKLTFHQDVADKYTLCPAGLRRPAYLIWKRVLSQNNQPKPGIKYKKIPAKRVVLLRNAGLWDFNFSTWDGAKVIRMYPKGHVADVVAVATNRLGAKYYMTAWSYDNGTIRATQGFNVVDCEDLKEASETPINTSPVREVPTRAVAEGEEPVFAESPIIEQDRFIDPNQEEEMKTQVINTPDTPLWEAIKELARLLLLSVVPIVVTFLLDGDYFVSVPLVTALLRAVDKYIHEDESTNLNGLVPF